MASKKIIVDAAGAATAADATVTDILTTVFSTDSALTGSYALIQKAALFVGGMSLQNSRCGNGWNPLRTNPV